MFVGSLPKWKKLCLLEGKADSHKENWLTCNTLVLHLVERNHILMRGKIDCLLHRLENWALGGWFYSIMFSCENESCSTVDKLMEKGGEGANMGRKKWVWTS